jgi:hypothetical protein
MLTFPSRRTTALATLLAIPASLVGMAAALAEDVTFRIDNDTNASIVEFYISPVTSDSWEDNVVPPGGELAPGGSVMMTVEDGSPACQYDMLAIFSNGNEVDDYNINICDLEVWVYDE